MFKPFFNFLGIRYNLFDVFLYFYYIFVAGPALYDSGYQWYGICMFIMSMVLSGLITSKEYPK